MEPERRCKSGMDGGLTAAILVSPLLHLRMDDFLSNRWGPPQRTDLLRLFDAERARLEAELLLAQRTAEYRQSIARLEAAEGVNQQ